MLTGETNRWQKHLVNFLVYLTANFPMENNLFELSKIMIIPQKTTTIGHDYVLTNLKRKTDTLFK